MSFVDCYLLYCMQQLITHPLSACLPFQSLLTESSCGEQLLAPPPSPVCSEHPSLLCVPFQFLVYYSVVVVVLQGRGRSVQGAMLAYPRGGCGSTVCLLFAHLLVCIQ
jgi:hypothetical protein